MAPEKRSNYLDANDSEDDQSQGYDSEAEVQKGAVSSKRRKINADESEDDSDSGAESPPPIPKSTNGTPKSRESPDDTSRPDDKSAKRKPTATLPTTSKPLTKKNLVASAEAIRKSGVLYISKIPPFMKPAKLRSLLSPYGTINRTYLAPEDPISHARRVRNGGNKKRSFTEGWVEFTRKRDAKRACELLNARPIGGKKGSYYYDDVWSMRYLRGGFKWHHLTEQIAAENAERESRMRAEIGKTTRENREFVRNVEQAKVLDGMQAKAKAKKERKGGVQEDGDGDGDGDGEERLGRVSKMKFKQIPLVKKRTEGQKPPEEVTRVLSKIF